MRKTINVDKTKVIST